MSDIKEWKINNPEKLKAQRERWKAKNPRRMIGYIKNWRAKNPDKVKEYSKRSRQTPAGKRRRAGQKAKQRAIRAGAEIVKLVDYHKMYVNRPENCPLCHLPMPEELVLDIDHIVSLADGGDHVEANLQVIHMWCHRRKTEGVEPGPPIRDLDAGMRIERTKIGL